MSKVTDNLERMLAVLRAFPDDGKPEKSASQEVIVDLISYNLIERREVQKACQCCGTPRLDYSFFRITPAGRLILAMDAKRQEQEGDEVAALKAEVERLHSLAKANNDLARMETQHRVRLQWDNAKLRDAIEYAHSEGFEWPSDPLAALSQPTQTEVSNAG
jgi:hypothetical protein